MTTDFMIIADATKVSPADFLAALLGREPETAEAKAERRRQWEEQTRRECAEYRAGMEARAARLRAIEDERKPRHEER